MTRIAAVALKDLRQQGRFTGLFVMRGVYAFAAAGVLVLLVPSLFVMSSAGMPPAAAVSIIQFWFAAWALVQGVLALAWAVAGADGMSRERMGHTLRLMHLTHIRPAEILLGKLSADLCSLLTLYAAPLPVLVLLSWLGGISLGSGIEATTLALTTGMVGLSLGLVMGTRWTGIRPVVYTAALLLMFYLGPLLQGTLLQAVSPFHAAVALWEVAMQTPPGRRTASTGAAAGVNLVLCLVLLAVGAWLVRGTDREESRADKQNSSANRAGELRGNPVDWLVRAAGLLPPTLPYLGATTVIAGGLFALLPRNTAAVPAITLYGAGLILVLLLAPLYWTCGVYRREKGDLLLTQLASVPMRSRTIVHGQFQASARGYLLAFLPLILFGAILLIGRGLSPAWLAVLGFHAFGYSLLALELGLFFGIRARRRLKTFFLAAFFAAWLYAATAALAFGISSTTAFLGSWIVWNGVVTPQGIAMLFVFMHSLALFLVTWLFQRTDARYLELELGRAL